MSVIEQLDNKLKEVYMKGPVSVLTKYEDLDVLISESLKDNEFRIG